MAKKKRSKKIKKADFANGNDQSTFWPLAGAVILCLVAVLLLLGGFGTGGALPLDMFKGVYWALGWAAYLSPVVLLCWGVYKFKSDDRQIPIAKLFSMAGVLIFASAMFDVIFAKKNNGLWLAGHGGSVGSVIGKAGLSILDKFPAALVFFVLAILTIFFAFGISLKSVLKLGKLFRRQDKNPDGELAALKAHADNGNFTLNEGVPVIHHSAGEREQSKMGNFKPSVMSGAEERRALTTASDPNWQLPPLDLLSLKQDKADAGDVNGNAQTIKETFENFNINVEMEGANVGPRVTQYTLRPPTGVKLTKITALENNLALDLAAHSIRIEAPIPGKRAVGIEVPNVKPATVRVGSILQSREWQDTKSPLAIAIGKDITGTSVVADLDKMPHLLIAGQTGSGKSVMVNTLLTSLLYHNSPSDLKLILVDPKQVELKPYDDIPHLLAPVITEPEKCISALKWAVAEMERRYNALAEAKRRNIVEYNNYKQEAGMPYIVIVIDELADLMMMAARDVESLVVRIAQKARAVGIHLVLATQRPSVDVITGLIKANITARIAFTTVSQVDSRTIIDQAGAEKLLGQGDMLLLTADMPKPKRLQGAFIENQETTKVTDFIRMQRPPQYDDEVISQPVQITGKGGIVLSLGGASDVDDAVWRDAVRVVIEAGKASTSLLQRRLRIGYGRAARLIETMEDQGIVGQADGSRPREVLVSSIDDVFGTHTHQGSDTTIDDELN